MLKSLPPSVPSKILFNLIKSAQKDPKLPPANPTSAFWQEPPSSISTIQSPTLPTQTDYAIIGSGVTACSVAHNLLSQLPPDSKSTVTIFEARSLCSGATGRNGGHLLSPIPEEFCNEFNLKSPIGAIQTPAGAFWPYRLITGLYSLLLTQYPTRFSIDTRTPITVITHSPTTNPTHPYTLTTPRGPVHATKVIHCTNGWAGHLLPGMRGKIYPIRGTMSVQSPSPSLPREGGEKSWSTIDKTTYDPKDGSFSYGMYYITQNAHTGDVFIGGEKQSLEEILTADDSGVSSISKSTLESVLPSIFATGWKEGESPEVKSLWSGVLAFTPDQLPWVGKVPKSVTGRGGDGEWVAAGFNGYGMPLCWGCGEAVAGMLLGKEREVREWLPRSFETTGRRLGSLFSTPEAGVVGMLGVELGWVLMGRLVVGWLARVVKGWVSSRLGGK
ncbi:uncharacterized protein MYCGRDRAFT_50896 [Zymoseptoria tritici IPO323]|uniref:FAD dependent oxidoreductase domain-containing protein n=1 Tax=Zymoseptoria tritici (strain CBS 115943 / IPO323) TaxID=336722 RepID=F9XP42_ZYMTI|nr:uncharacterized protein MYCGRDRAFT_50896 [Zymoseptoria tritici IPO323]EGP83060.1 hypothetical protein MYCGRDRAFT_50896 [Zymoseptoria tritici IPO323]